MIRPARFWRDSRSRRHRVLMNVLGILFGLACFAAGVYGYIAKGAPRFFVTGNQRNGVYGLIPLGLGFVLFGLGGLIWHHPLTDIFFMVGLALAALGVLLIFWHPRWIRPWWLKDGPTWL
jgi:hypothetical protein